MVTAIVWLLPAVHWNVWGAVAELPSTVMLNPGGFVVIVIPCGALVKVAVTVRAALMVTETGFVVPDTAPLQPENRLLLLGVAVSCTDVALL